MTIRTWSAALACVFAGWLTLMIGLTYFTDAAPGAVAIFADQGFYGSLQADIEIRDAGPNWVSVASSEPNLGPRLYEAGAWIVLPAGLKGCLEILL